MSDQTNAAIEVLAQALQNEQRTYDFYIEAAKKVTQEKGRAMFHELANEELVHVKVVRMQYESLKAGLGWAAVPDLEAVTEVDISPLNLKRTEMEARVKESSSDLDALVIAAEMENNSFTFYVEQYAVATDPLAKKLYGSLINAERNHFNTVMANWEALVHTGQWVGRQP